MMLRGGSQRDIPQIHPILAFGEHPGVWLKLSEHCGGRQEGRRALSSQLGPYSYFPQDLPHGDSSALLRNKSSC